MNGAGYLLAQASTVSKHPRMKTILCFGDSNTWGFDPVSLGSSPYALRFPHDVRWTGVLACELGAGFHVIEEGLNGRTTVFDDPLMPHRNGSVYLPACLESHKPIDLVVLMLGTNDLKRFFNVSPGDIANGAMLLSKTILQSECGPASGPPRLLLISPAMIGDMSRLNWLAEKFEDPVARSKRFPEFYSTIAKQLGCEYLNAQEHVVSSPQDGIHWEATEHAKFGKAVAAKVNTML